MTLAGWFWTTMVILCGLWWWWMVSLAHPTALWLFCDMLRLC